MFPSESLAVRSALNIIRTLQRGILHLGGGGGEGGDSS